MSILLHSIEQYIHALMIVPEDLFLFGNLRIVDELAVTLIPSRIVLVNSETVYQHPKMHMLCHLIQDSRCGHNSGRKVCSPASSLNFACRPLYFPDMLEAPSYVCATRFLYGTFNLSISLAI